MDLYGRLRFGKRFRGERQQGLGCILIFGFKLQSSCLRALMEIRQERPHLLPRACGRSPYIRFTFLRSNLLCHHSSIDLRNLLA